MSIVNRILSIFSLFWILLSCSIQQAAVQDTYAGPSQQIQGNVKDMTMDELGYIYLLTKDNQFHRCNDTFKLLFTFSNKRLGNIHSVDVSNPLKLIVYYNQYGVVTALDNTLTESFVLDLHEFGYEDVQAIGLSSDNQIWLYDPLDFKLKKIDRQGNLLFESNNMVHERLESMQPIHLQEAFNKVYLFEEDKLFLFDDYGKFLSELAMPEMRHYQIDNNGDVIWSDGSSLYLLPIGRPEDVQTLEVNLDLTEVHKFIILRSKIIVLNADGYYHFKNWE